MRPVLIILIILAITLTACSEQPQVTINEETFDVKVVDAPETRARGLMFVENMPENEGMLFIFEQTRPHPFWMKNTLIPLDMIWISENKEILHIEKATPCTKDPCTSYGPNEETQAKYVLEINGGLSEKYKFQKGQLVTIRGI